MSPRTALLTTLALALAGSAAAWLLSSNEGGLVRRTHYADGTPWSEVRLADGVPQGLWRTWHADGTPKSEGHYRNGRREGAWTTWHEGGALLSRGAYVRGRQEGHWEYGFASGQRASEGAYADGRLSGTWRWWYGDGTLRSEASFDEEGLEHDLATKYWPDGTVELVRRYDHGVRVAERAVAEDGRVRWEGAFEDGERVGPWRAWRRDGSYNTDLSGMYAAGVKVAELPEVPTTDAERFEP